MFKYKGYQGVVEFDYDANIFFGEVANLRDVITFQGTSVKELVQSFRDSVDEYLKFCEELGRTPETPFSGQLLVQVTPQIHREIANHARRRNISLEAWASDTLQKALAC
ncbi:MAG: type II toxin-antitoxin system HicB family antitoxin [Ardenticatenaceae bacterium]